MSFLPGWCPGSAVASRRLTTIVKQDDSSFSGMAATITAPDDIIAGDMLVMADFTFGAYSPPAAVTPAGWTNIINLAVGTKSRGMVHYKLANGSEASSVITGMNGATGFTSKVIATFRGNIPATLLTISGVVNSQATTGDPTAQNVAASGGLPPLVVLGFYMASAAVDPRTMSPAKDGEVAPSDNGNWIAWKIYNTAPANVSVDMADEGENILGSTYIQMA